MEYCCFACGCAYELPIGAHAMCPNGCVSIQTAKIPKDRKCDQGKPKVYQMKKDFGKALLAVADVTSYGVEKYQKPGSWKEVVDAYDRYEDALGRHDLQSTFERNDLESARLHLAHRAWNALATLQILLEEVENE